MGIQSTLTKDRVGQESSNLRKSLGITETVFGSEPNRRPGSRNATAVPPFGSTGVILGSVQSARPYNLRMKRILAREWLSLLVCFLIGLAFLEIRDWYRHRDQHQQWMTANRLWESGVRAELPIAKGPDAARDNYLNYLSALEERRYLAPVEPIFRYWLPLYSFAPLGLAIYGALLLIRLTRWSINTAQTSD